MKSTLFLIPLLALPLHAQILATFETSRGDVVVDLQYDKTPQTVANFITLAEGTRSTLDAATGAVRPKRYYAGEGFYRVVNDPGFKIAQTGSGTGTNSGGPGYKFRDEFHPDLRHDPYVLAMANGGPNTNGSQIYFTGSAAIPSLDGRHTVFGLVNDPASRTVIDAIISAGDDATMITDVTIQRNGAAAQAFDEFAHELPVCSAVPGALAVTKSGALNNVIYTPDIPLPPASIFRVSNSLQLQSWVYAGQFVPDMEFPAGVGITIDQTSQHRRFYNISLTSFPNQMRQISLANRTMVLEGIQGSVTYTLEFDGSGVGGVLTKSTDPETLIIFESDHNPEAYGSTLVVYTLVDWPLFILTGFDSETPEQVLGRHSTDQVIAGQRSPFGEGSLTLSK